MHIEQQILESLRRPRNPCPFRDAAEDPCTNSECTWGGFGPYPELSDCDIAKRIGRPEPSVRRARLKLQRAGTIRYAGARYEQHATVQTWRLP